MNKELFNKLKEEALTDLKIPDSLPEMMELRLSLPSTIQKWNEYYVTQNTICSKLENNRKELYAKLENEWKFHKDVAWSGKELSNQVQGDARYLALLREIAEQEFFRDYIKGTLETLRGNVYTIRDYLEYKKLIQL